MIKRLAYTGIVIGLGIIVWKGASPVGAIILVVAAGIILAQTLRK
jgi:hypothetical protein